MKIILCPNPFRDKGLKAAQNAGKLLSAAGAEVTYCFPFPVDKTTLGEIDRSVRIKDLRHELPGADFLVCFGGDGTILSVARKLREKAVPLLGINLGTKGFMANLEPEKLPLILRAAAGDMSISRRMMLDVSLIREGELICTDHALNDVVIHGYGDCIQLTASCNDSVTGFTGTRFTITIPSFFRYGM